jgi:hypothetical protein
MNILEGECSDVRGICFRVEWAEETVGRTIGEVVCQAV